MHTGDTPLSGTDRWTRARGTARRRLGGPGVKALALCIPLAFTGTLSSASQTTDWNVSGSRTAGDRAWLDGLVGRVSGSPGGQSLPSDALDPNAPVTPSGGDPQVLVLGGGGSADDADATGGRGAGDTAATRALTSSGIPVRTLKAYLAAAQITARLSPRCNLHWSLLAGIGRVETNHGRHGGASVLADGRVTPSILGPRLNGTNGFAFIRDQDGGRWDGDASADRAMGPMQFIPGTWKMMGTDADGDGTANPQDVDDAALAAARYLCSGGVDLATQQGRWKAVFRYNHSNSYVALVLGLADSYRRGAAEPVPSQPPGVDVTPDPADPPASVATPPVVAALPPSGTSSTPGTSSPVRPRPATTPSTTPSPTPSTSVPTRTIGSTPSPTATRTASPSPTATRTASPSPSPTSTTASPSPTRTSAAPSPTPSTPTPTTTGSPSATPQPTGSPSPTPSGSGSPAPTDLPTCEPEATPTGSATPTPSPTATPDPEASPTPFPTCTPAPAAEADAGSGEKTATGKD